MPTLRRFAWTEEGRTGPFSGAGVAVEGELALGGVEVLLKKEVIWRCEGSLAVPANWRFVRGPDIGFAVVSLACM